MWVRCLFAKCRTNCVQDMNKVSNNFVHPRVYVAHNEKIKLRIVQIAFNFAEMHVELRRTKIQNFQIFRYVISMESLSVFDDVRMTLAASATNFNTRRKTCEHLLETETATHTFSFTFDTYNNTNNLACENFRSDNEHPPNEHHKSYSACSGTVSGSSHLVVQPSQAVVSFCIQIKCINNIPRNYPRGN